jgi:hypothetical protein
VREVAATPDPAAEPPDVASAPPEAEATQRESTARTPDVAAEPPDVAGAPPAAEATQREAPVPTQDVAAAPPEAAGGETIALAAASPAPAADAASVLVHVNARPWARIDVDGRELGLTPLGNVPLTPGVRRFRIEMPDGRVLEREVRVDEHTRRLTFP